MFSTQKFLCGARGAAAWVAGLLVVTPSAYGQTVDAPGYIYSHIDTTDTTQSCVAHANGGTFVGSGPNSTGNAQSVVFLTEAGGERTVVSGLNAIGDCAYDAALDILYITDHGLEESGSVTGDTAYGIPNASVAQGLRAEDFQLAPAGSIPDASSVALDSNRDIFISDPTGAGAGSIRKIHMVNPASWILTNFKDTLDLVGGLAWQLGGGPDLFAAEELALTGQTLIRRYGEGGIVVGPGNTLGTADLAVTPENKLLVTGLVNGPIHEVDPSDGATVPLISGFAFASSIDVDPFTGRIALVSTSAGEPEEDERLHLLTPVSRLALGHKRDELDRRECLLEFYGAELALTKGGAPTKRAVCTDGALCDADGEADGTCTFPLGVCLSVVDDRVPRCMSDGTTFFELKKAKPENATVSALVARVEAALPTQGPQCFFSGGVEVVMRQTKQGELRLGKQTVKLKSKSEAPVGQTDLDTVKLVCEPAEPPAT